MLFSMFQVLLGVTMMPSKRERDLEKAWKYVGRFMHSFAQVEAGVDNIFGLMFNLNAISYLLLYSSLDLHKKLDLVEFGFKDQGVDHGKILYRVRELSTIRNAIAHSSFEPVLSGHYVEDGK